MLKLNILKIGCSIYQMKCICKKTPDLKVVWTCLNLLEIAIKMMAHTCHFDDIKYSSLSGDIPTVYIYCQPRCQLSLTLCPCGVEVWCWLAHHVIPLTISLVPCTIWL